MSDTATFKSHLHKVCTAVIQKCSWILRTFNCRSTPFMKFMWKRLVQGHIDYCSQLYMPNQTAELRQLENLQKCFTKKIPELRDLNYWQRLSHLKMNSQERRLERYRIIYTWKILEELVPNCGLKVTNSDRRGREVCIPPLKGSSSIRKLRDQSFQVNGPKLFNCLPPAFRKISKVSVEQFKEKLDLFLTNIPDEPNVDGLTPGACDPFTAAPSNSIIDQSGKLKTRRPGA